MESMLQLNMDLFRDLHMVSGSLCWVLSTLRPGGNSCHWGQSSQLGGVPHYQGGASVLAAENGDYCPHGCHTALATSHAHSQARPKSVSARPDASPRKHASLGLPATDSKAGGLGPRPAPLASLPPADPQRRPAHRAGSLRSWRVTLRNETAFLGNNLIVTPPFTA